MKRRDEIRHYSLKEYLMNVHPYLRLPFLAAGLLLMAACNSTTVLLANFNAEPLGAPPAFTQPTGAMQFVNGAGSVTIANPPGSTTKWMRVSHPTQPSPETVTRARFDAPHGAGKYNLITALFIPTGTGAVTLQLEPFNGSIDSSPELLHLDFMPENNVRLNDNDADRFGTFPRDQSFLVSIFLDSTVSPPSARISLLGGGGASGQRDVTLPSGASSFGAVRLWMGFQWTGSFFVDDLVVTRRNP
jgi:hypothetical protein